MSENKIFVLHYIAMCSAAAAIAIAASGSCAGTPAAEDASIDVADMGGDVTVNYIDHDGVVRSEHVPRAKIRGIAENARLDRLARERAKRDAGR